MSTGGKLPAHRRYVLITAAYNEGQYIEKTINSVLEQRVLPAKWVIVSDGSTDGTDDIVQTYASGYKFIQFIRREKDGNKGFASKVFALAAGLKSLTSIDYGYLGHLDADITFSASYFGNLLDRFEMDPHLGIAGGLIYEGHNGRFLPRRSNSLRSVAGAVQMFRRECYEDIGGFIPLIYGGEDWYAEIAARMNGWHVSSFPELPVLHLRPGGRANGFVRYAFRQGFMDYSLGSHPLFELVKLAKRVPCRPFLMGAVIRLAGYISACCQREARVVSPQFVSFLRREQMSRLWSLGSFASCVGVRDFTDDLSS